MAIRVHLTDDHAVFRDGLRMLLECHEDIAVVGSAGDGRQAVEDVLALRPDIAVMDIAMPLLNGIEATARIREEAPAVRVIVLSMHETSEHVFRALRAGARGYLLKSSAGEEVVQAIRAVHQGRRYLSSQITETVIKDYLVAGHPASPLDSLSQREREIAQHVAEGKTSAQIAELLSLSPKSVESYRSRLMEKIGVEDVPGLVKFAIAHGLTSLD